MWVLIAVDAASDAYAGLRIFDALQVRRGRLKPRPPLPACRDIENVADDSTPSANTIATTAAAIAETRKLKKAAIMKSEDEEQAALQTSEPVSATDRFSSQIEVAGEWVSSYKLSSPDGEQQLSKSQLRAYSLWHVAQLDVEDICKIWRDPPLQESTLAGYILEALKIKHLPCDMDRAKALYRHVPYLLKERYRNVLEDEVYRL